MTRSYAIMLDAIGADTDNIPRHAKGRGVRPVADMETGAATEGTVIAQGLVRQDKGWWSFAYVSQANLADANIDISVTIPSWFAYKPPNPVVTKVVATEQV